MAQPYGFEVMGDVSPALEEDFRRCVRDEVSQVFYKELKASLGDGLSPNLGALDVCDGEYRLGGQRVKFVLMPGRTRADFMPIRDKINHEYLEAFEGERAEVKGVLNQYRHTPDYPFWCGLDQVLKDISTRLQGDMNYQAMTQIRIAYAPYFSLDNRDHLRRHPGSDLFRHLLAIFLILDRVFVLPEAVLGNFLPADLTREKTCIIEVYADAITQFKANCHDVIRHEFFHFFHYACVMDSHGKWLSYNTFFQQNLAVIESLARYYDGGTETLGVFPTNPYFGANYLRLFELLSAQLPAITYRDAGEERGRHIRNELSSVEIKTVDTLFRRCLKEDAGMAWRQLFILSLQDMKKAYHFMENIRQLCLTRVDIA